MSASTRSESVCIFSTTAPDFADCTLLRSSIITRSAVLRPMPGARVSRSGRFSLMAAESSSSGPVSKIASAERGPTPETEISISKNMSSPSDVNPKRSSASSRTWRWQKNFTPVPMAGRPSSVSRLAKSFSPKAARRHHRKMVVFERQRAFDAVYHGFIIARMEIKNTLNKNLTPAAL